MLLRKMPPAHRHHARVRTKGTMIRPTHHDTIRTGTKERDRPIIQPPKVAAMTNAAPTIICGQVDEQAIQIGVNKGALPHRKREGLPLRGGPDPGPRSDEHTPTAITSRGIT